MDALSGGLLQTKGKALLIGAGEAARAVGHALAISGKGVLITNRTMDRARSMADRLKKLTDASPVTMEEVYDNIKDVDLIVNCTPVGMKGFDPRSPLDMQFIPGGSTVFDIVYNPMQTELLRYARERGAKVVYGYEMFIGQGARSYELWTGRKAPVEEMRRVVLKQLRGAE
jgi:shikimate dehydrogenase